MKVVEINCYLRKKVGRKQELDTEKAIYTILKKVTIIQLKASNLTLSTAGLAFKAKACGIRKGKMCVPPVQDEAFVHASLREQNTFTQ